MFPNRPKCLIFFEHVLYRVSDKCGGLLISSFRACDWLLITTTNFTNQFIHVWIVQQSYDLNRYVTWQILKQSMDKYFSGTKFYLNINFLLLSIIISTLEKKNFSNTQKHVLETKMAWNQKLSPNPSRRAYNPL